MNQTPMPEPDDGGRADIRRALRNGWQEGHDLTCDFAIPGKQCEHHPNPYDAVS